MGRVEKDGDRYKGTSKRERESEREKEGERERRI